MKSTDIKKSQEVLKQLNKHIEEFLTKLIQEEFKLIDTPRVKKIIMREWSSCGMQFCSYKTEDSWNRTSANTHSEIKVKPTDFIIKHINDNSVDVIFNDSEINIPLEYTEEQFQTYCKTFFKPLLENLDDTEKEHKQYDIDSAARKKAEEKTLSVHKDGKYTYQWKKCENCNGDGKIQQGTGRYEYQGDYDREGDYIQSQVMETINCPDCHGSGGFIEYSIKGKYGSNTKPCSKWRFEQNQDDFISILTS